MRKDKNSRVRESEFRWAIYQTHNCETESPANVVQVKIPRNKGVSEEKTVYVFELKGHPRATRCYAWVEPLSNKAIIIQAVLHSDKISSPEKAVQSKPRRELDNEPRFARDFRTRS